MITNKDLNNFAEIIDECRNLVESVNVTVEISLQYIFSQLYCKTLLTMCEIYTLLVAGYPEGAMTLARNTYETMIIMSYLFERTEDDGLIERFYDDYSVKTCVDYIKYLEWLRANEKHNEDLEERLKGLKNKYRFLIEKHSDYTSGKNYEKYFKQYWWAGKNMSFNQLRKELKYHDNYLYNISCYRVHSGMAGLLRFDNSEEGLLIGPCESGKEMPMRFALLNFSVITNLYFSIQNINCSETFIKMTNLFDKIK